MNFVEIGITDYVCAINSIMESEETGTRATLRDKDTERNVKCSYNLGQKI